MPTTDPPDPCDQTTDFTFLGRASPQQLGIAGPMDPMGGQVGTVWVTAQPVDWGGGGMAPLARAVCVQFDDGSGMGQPIEDDWELPAGAIDAAAGDAAGSPPIGLLAALAMLILLVLVSVVAFAVDGRRRPTA